MHPPEVYDECEIKEIACRYGFRYPQSVENKKRLLSTMVIHLDQLLCEVAFVAEECSKPMKPVKEPKPCKPVRSCDCDCPVEFEPEEGEGVR